jgi:hypothetical protein
MLILIFIVCILNCLFIIHGLKETNKRINKLEATLDDIKKNTDKR